VGDAGDSRIGVADEGHRAVDLAELPQCEREVQHRLDARVGSETKGEAIVPSRLEQRERLFQMLARPFELSFAIGQLAGGCEGFFGFLRAEAARRNERVAVGYLQLSSLTRGTRLFARALQSSRQQPDTH
jgi:hypothetical protein